MVYKRVMLEALGGELKRAREAGGASLQAIAEGATISAAYLHKLERGAVGTPSPRVLRRLAGALGLDYLHLMELADYLSRDEAAEVTRGAPRPRPHPLADQGLTPDEWRTVGAFIKALKTRRPGGGA
jgi:transcriptional regulator with XRE-family HTH domain